MTIFNTQLHIVTFLITVFESVMLLFATVWYLFRPHEKARERYMILLALLIQYNVFSGLFPDEDMDLPLKLQVILIYYGGVSVSVYFVY